MFLKGESVGKREGAEGGRCYCKASNVGRICGEERGRFLPPTPIFFFLNLSSTMNWANVFLPLVELLVAVFAWQLPRMRNKTPGLNWGGGCGSSLPPGIERVRWIATAPGLCGLWVCTGESGGEGVKAEMTLLAWIVVLVLHSLLSLVVMMCNCHLLQCLVHGSSQGLARGCYFQLRGSRPELTRGNFARPPEPGSPRSRPGSHFSP